MKLARTRLPILIAVLVTACPIMGQPGANDPLFNPDDIGNGTGDGWFASSTLKVAQQADGKLVLTQSGAYNGLRTSVIRLLHDGDLDPGFQVPDDLIAALELAISPSGGILVSGDFTSVGGVPRPGLAMLHANGDLDPDFDPGTGANGTIRHMCFQPDGKVVIIGNFTSVAGAPRARVARLNMDGSVDPAFDPGEGPGPGQLNTLALQNNGKVLIGGSFTTFGSMTRNGIARLNVDGSYDQTYAEGAGFTMNSGTVHIDHISVEDDDSAIISGTFSAYDGHPCAVAVRIGPNGSMDTGFVANTAFTHTTTPMGRASLVLPDGRIYVAGHFTTVGGIPRKSLVRLMADGSMDDGFDPDGCWFMGPIPTTFPTPAWLAVDTASALVIGPSSPQPARMGPVRLLPDGTCDDMYNSGTGFDRPVHALASRPDGRFLVGGNFSKFNSVPVMALVQLHSNGTLDTSFETSTDIWQLSNVGRVNAIAVQPDGYVVVGGRFNRFHGEARTNLVRLDADGGLDQDFEPPILAGLGGDVGSIVVRPNGRLVLGGRFWGAPGRNCITQLLPDGTPDEDFASGSGFGNGTSPVNALVLQPDGRLLVGGRFHHGYNGSSCGPLLRLHQNATLDDLDPQIARDNPMLTPEVTAIALHDDGAIVFAGVFDQVDGVPRKGIARLLSNGVLDHEFEPGDGPEGLITTIIPQPDGRIILLNLTAYDGVSVPGIARILPDGSLDDTFVPGLGFTHFWHPYMPEPAVAAAVMTTQGQLVVGGGFTAYDGTGRNRLARIDTGMSTSVATIIPRATLTIFPNPSSGSTWVDVAGEGAYSLSVYDQTGRLLAEQSDIRKGPLHLDMQPFAPGVYSVVVQDAVTTWTGRVVME